MKVSSWIKSMNTQSIIGFSLMIIAVILSVLFSFTPGMQKLIAASYDVIKDSFGWTEWLIAGFGYVFWCSGMLLVKKS